MITATDLEVRAGARTLVYAPGPALRIQPGDRIGLVGRNGAGKTTSMRILAGEGEPYAGSVSRIGEIGYLPQDPKEEIWICWLVTGCCRRAAWTPSSARWKSSRH